MITNELELTESQYRTYLMLQEGDRDAAENYKQYCLEVVVQPEKKHHPEFQHCSYCKKKFYRKIGEAPSNFALRSNCSKTCGDNAKTVNKMRLKK